MAKINYCTVHKIGYNTDLDPGCPQCALRGLSEVEQVDDQEWERRKQAAQQGERPELTQAER